MCLNILLLSHVGLRLRTSTGIFSRYTGWFHVSISDPSTAANAWQSFVSVVHRFSSGGQPWLGLGEVTREPRERWLTRRRAWLGLGALNAVVICQCAARLGGIGRVLWTDPSPPKATTTTCPRCWSQFHVDALMLLCICAHFMRRVDCAARCTAVQGGRRGRPGRPGSLPR